MKYHVTMEEIGTPPVLSTSPQELVQHLEHVVIPLVETLVKLEREKKILAGGAVAGARAGMFIVEAASNEELEQLLMSIPGWDLFKIEVTPLQSYEGRTKIVRQTLERLKVAQR